MASLFTNGKFQAENASGPVPGAKLYSYAAGTTTPLATYTDQGGLSSNTNPVICNAAGQASVWLGASAYRMILKDASDVVIWDVDNISSAADASNVSFTEAGVGAIARTVSSKLNDTVSVLDFGADATGAADSYAAFAAAWAAIKSTGGTVLIPPGSYLLNTQWVLDVDLTLPHNYLISGYGATLFAGASVTGHAIKVYKGYNNFGVQIAGLQFNHRNNSTVNGCIQAQGANNLRVERCAVEHHNTKATYSGIELGPYTAGNDNTNTFWAVIDGFTTRMRTGGDGTSAAAGVRIKGAANATKIINCTFASVVDGVRIETDATSATLVNALRILDNDFEGVTNAITLNTALPATVMPTGVIVAFNRVETATTFFNINGAAVTNHSYPPALLNNYLTVGSVTNYLVNPNSQFVFSSEPSYFGVGARNYVGGPANYQIITEGSGKNVVLADLSGNSGYSAAHLVMASHYWTDAATGRMFTKSSAPSSAQDGAMVGSISGTATFAAGTTVTVTIGFTMAANTYKVAISGSANKTFWVSAKTTTQFTLNASGVSSDTVDWQLTV